MNCKTQDVTDKILTFFGLSLDSKLSEQEAQKVRAFIWAKKRAEDRLKRGSPKTKLMPDSFDAVLASARSKRESPIEEALLLALNTRSICFGKLKTQFEVGPYRIDLAFPEAKLAVECDGKAYHSEPAQILRDQRRTRYLARLGWTVLRFSGREIKRSLHDCIDRITRTYERICSEKELRESWEEQP